MSKKKISNVHNKLYGTVKVGERGQIVLPIELRKEMSIMPGDQLLIFRNTEQNTIVAMTLDALSNYILDVGLEESLTLEIK